MPDVLTRIAAGEADAMDECLDRYGGLVWSLANRLGDRSEVDDAVQEVFVELWRVAGKFDAAQSSEKTFIAMIARRRLIDRRRSAQRRIETTTLESAAPTTEPGDAVEDREEATRARRLMLQLRDEERRVLELAIDHGMSQPEIAETTGLALGTVKTHARRGMIRLRELLKTPQTQESKGGLR